MRGLKTTEQHLLKAGWLTIIAGDYEAKRPPIAYVAFLAMINQELLMDDAGPCGTRRLI